MSRFCDEQDRRRSAAEDAASWIARLDEGAMSAGERAALADWLRESPVHVAELLRASRLASALHACRFWSESGSSCATVGNNVVFLRQVWLRRAGQENPRRKWAQLAAAALTITALAILAPWVMLHNDTQQLHTGSAERREFALEDGSIVLLSPATDLSVSMKPTQRLLELHRGEAEFRVAKDASRPFILHAALARVEAIGTVFTVSRTASLVTVSVTEGRVHILPMEDLASDLVPTMPLALITNDRAKLSVGGEISEINRAESTPDPAWRTLELVFEETTVREVAERFNRRNHLRVVIDDAVLAERRVSGFFNPDDPQSFVDFLMVVAGARVSRSDASEIVVTGHAAPQT